MTKYIFVLVIGFLMADAQAIARETSIENIEQSKPRKQSKSKKFKKKKPVKGNMGGSHKDPAYK